MILFASLLVIGDVWLPVYSHEQSTDQLHVQSCVWDSERNCIDDGNRNTWTFPAEYTGKRSVCYLPGATNATGFIAWVGGDTYSVGDPFGYTPAASGGNVQAVDLTRTTAVSPRINLWADASDRKAWFGEDSPLPSKLYEVSAGITQECNIATIPLAELVRVRVVRLRVNGVDGVSDFLSSMEGNYFDGVVLDRTFFRGERNFICEGDFLGGAPDIGWSNLSTGLEYNLSAASISNAEYAVVFGDGAVRDNFSADGARRPYTAHPIVISRRFEVAHTPPTAIGMTGGAHPTFNFRIDGEDPWASRFGSTYTAFKAEIYSIVDMADGEGRSIAATNSLADAIQSARGTNYSARVTLGSARQTVNGRSDFFPNNAPYIARVVSNTFEKCASGIALCRSVNSAFTNAVEVVCDVIGNGLNSEAAAAGVAECRSATNNAAVALARCDDAQFYFDKVNLDDLAGGKAYTAASNCLDCVNCVIEAVDAWQDGAGIVSHAFASSTVEVDFGVQRMPPKRPDGSYRWTAPAAYTNRTTWGSWRIFTYNSKFRDTDPSTGSQVMPIE